MLRRAIQGRAECPICRAPLKPGDLFDAATAEEEESQRLLNENMGNYGAKVPSSHVWLVHHGRAPPGASPTMIWLSPSVGESVGETWILQCIWYLTV